MTKDNNTEPDFKRLAGDGTVGLPYDIDPKLFNQQIAQHIASGTLDNDKLPLCRICKQNGFPHEPLRFEKVYGRIRSDGTNEAKQWILRDYFNGNRHVHRSKAGETG